MSHTAYLQAAFHKKGNPPAADGSQESWLQPPQGSDQSMDVKDLWDHHIDCSSSHSCVACLWSDISLRANSQWWVRPWKTGQPKTGTVQYTGNPPRWGQQSWGNGSTLAGTRLPKSKNKRISNVAGTAGPTLYKGQGPCNCKESPIGGPNWGLPERAMIAGPDNISPPGIAV